MIEDLPDDEENVDYVKIYFDLKERQKNSEHKKWLLSEQKKAYKKNRSKFPRTPKFSVLEIIAQAKCSMDVLVWYNIDHLKDEDFFKIADELTIFEFKRWYHHHKNLAGFVFNTPIFIRFDCLLRGNHWFSNDEFENRKAKGKKTYQVSHSDLLNEKVFDIFNRRDILIEDKVNEFSVLFSELLPEELLKKKVEYYNIILQEINYRDVLTGDEKLFISNQKKDQKKAVKKGHKDAVNFNTLNLLLMQYNIKLIP